MSTRPNFIGIGAQKCASTWLYEILADHPQALLAESKELDFFSYHYESGYQWYENHFPAQDGAPVRGEISPSYFHCPATPERVYEYNPDVQLILCLRNPVERALSNHKHEVRIGHLQGHDLSFENSLRNNPQYIDQGMYATHLTRWLRHFDRRQMLVILFDDVQSNPEAVARQVYTFLGIDPHHVSSVLNKASNPSYVNRSKFLEHLKNHVRSMVRKLHLGPIWRGIGDLGFRTLYRALNRAPSSSVIPPLEAATREFLDERFAPEIDQLEAILNRDLGCWRGPTRERAVNG